MNMGILERGKGGKRGEMTVRWLCVSQSTLGLQVLIWACRSHVTQGQREEQTRVSGRGHTGVGRLERAIGPLGTSRVPLGA